MEQQEYNNNRWSIDKTIHVSHIINILAIAGAVMIFLLSYEHRITTNEVGIINNEKQLVKLEDDVKDGFKVIFEKLDRIEDKLDKKVDK